MTVREEIQEELFYGYGMQKEDMLECMEIAIQEINDTYKRVLEKKNTLFGQDRGSSVEPH